MVVRTKWNGKIKNYWYRLRRKWDMSKWRQGYIGCNWKVLVFLKMSNDIRME